jgi:hypothetical protein
MRTLALDRTTALVVERLRAAGIPSLLLKGASFARWLYTEEAERGYVDIDLFVPPMLAARAERKLAELGFTRSGFETILDDRPRHAVTLLGPNDEAVDLHRTLFGVADGDRLFVQLSADAEAISVGGADVQIPSERGRALVLALHAAKDAGRSEKVKRDLAQAVRILPRAGWVSAARMALELGALEEFAAGLRSEPDGEELAADLGLSLELGPATALRSTRSPPLAYGLDYLLKAPGMLAKVRFALRKAFPPASFMRAWSATARRGSLGLAAAYGFRPFWLLWRSVPAVRAVQRARRKARASSSED